MEFVNKVEVNYCSLCRDYIPSIHASKEEKTILEHCRSKKHLKWYYQSKNKDDVDPKFCKSKNEDEPLKKFQETSKKAFSVKA